MEFSRYVGATPDGDAQAQHFSQLEEAFASAQFESSRVSNGIVANGATNPIAAAALLFAAADPAVQSSLAGPGPHHEEVEFLGTSFAFRQTNVFLTAAHCVHGRTPASLFVNTPGSSPLEPVSQVLEVHEHPSADLALLMLGDQAWPGGVEPFVDFSARASLGTEFMAYGFPEDAPSPGALRLEPTARLFRGHFQRTFLYQRNAYTYQAGEMSVPSPAGLSGGALFDPHDLNKVIAVATENVESLTYVGQFVEITSDRGTERTIERNQVQYGIAALLESAADWLSELVPYNLRTVT